MKIYSIDELRKAKPYVRTRMGKFEHVKGYASNLGEPYSTEKFRSINIKLTQQMKEEKMISDLIGKNPPTTVPPSIKNKINTELHEINTTYHSAIPLDRIFNSLEKRGLVPLQEDNTEWSGFLLGREGQIYLPLAAK